MIDNNEKALDLIVSSIKAAGFKNGKDVSICLDVAANELFKSKKYSIHPKKFISVDQTINKYLKIINKYKIKSIEDPFAENDWTSWSNLMKSTKNVQIVGDDLYVTNLERLKKGFLNNSSNSILIKLNQIGTVSETLAVIKFAQIIGYKTIISHRSGDSEDTFIADLAVGTNSNPPMRTIRSRTSATPLSDFIAANTNGRSPRMRFASRSITSSEAPT